LVADLPVRPEDKLGANAVLVSPVTAKMCAMAISRHDGHGDGFTRAGGELHLFGSFATLLHGSILVA
jgi:hypothetical protein